MALSNPRGYTRQDGTMQGKESSKALLHECLESQRSDYEGSVAGEMGERESERRVGKV